QFHLVYQPICTLTSGQVTSVEALLRWTHPTRGELLPADFIPVLEESGQIVEVGRWVLAEACKQAVAWRNKGIDVAISVNVSARQLATESLVVDVRDALSESGLDPDALILEITETAVMADIATSARLVAALKSLGVRISLDDFGTGYSSLAYLREFPVDTLKIDRTFVAGLGSSKEANAIVRTLVQLGTNLGIETVAEGIEEIAQYQQLEDERCEYGQGFLIAHPLPAADVETFLKIRGGKGNQPRNGSADDLHALGIDSLGQPFLDADPIRPLFDPLPEKCACTREVVHVTHARASEQVD
ncbi:MAG: putative diguanylate cyclase/phosphodiesterase with sensor, partial [Mycobacterium sp.]|nr:putative diguanylate cyclase/phosphodiesterase with sensor [Mycobacterium sp.]